MALGREAGGGGGGGGGGPSHHEVRQRPPKKQNDHVHLRNKAEVSYGAMMFDVIGIAHVSIHIIKSVTWREHTG